MAEEVTIPYQAVNFHYLVEFNHKDSPIDDIGFQSVTGFDSTLETEPLKEGGENRYVHALPMRRNYSKLVLKRGVWKPGKSKLTDWLKRNFDDELESEVIEPVETVVITLLNEEHQPLMRWRVNNVWPTSWKIGELNAEQGGVLIETLELNYNRLVFEEVPESPASEINSRIS
ncbi:MAG: phage tail protein [Chitinophagaceae bacterium]|nr:phage tail protein [Chitinophagaceae bacterium]